MRRTLITLLVMGILTAVTSSVWADGRDRRGDWDRGGSRFGVSVRYYTPIYRPYVYTQPVYPVYVVRPAPVYVAPAPIYVQPAPVYVQPAPVYYPAATYYPVYQPVVQRGLFDGLSVFIRFGR